MTQTSRPTVAVIGLALALAAVQVHNIVLFSSGTLAQDVEAALGVTTGHPHWRVDQARLLGPWLLRGLTSLLSGDSADAYLLVIAASLLVAGVQAWRLGRLLGDGRTGWLALIGLHLLFFISRSRPWLIVWDFVGLNVFLAFVTCVVERRRLPWFVALFTIAMLNRESGLYIAAWMMLEPPARWYIGRPMPGHSGWTMLAAGATCGVAGELFVTVVRRTLLVEEVMLTQLYAVPAAYGQTVFWTLPGNLSVLLHPTGKPLVTVLALAKGVMLLGALVAAAILLIRRDLERYLALGFTIGAVALATMSFAVLTETRVFVELLPFMLAGALVLDPPKSQTNEP